MSEAEGPDMPAERLLRGSPSSRPYARGARDAQLRAVTTELTETNQGRARALAEPR